MRSAAVVFLLNESEKLLPLKHPLGLKISGGLLTNRDGLNSSAVASNILFFIFTICYKQT